MDQLNVLGTELEVCSNDPLTGFFRDGCCNTDKTDFGSHTICVILTDAFLTFSKQKGNDLTTPRPEYGFGGLKPGDRWCLCATRWLEAKNAGYAPRVKLLSTNIKALEIVQLSELQDYQVDLN